MITIHEVSHSEGDRRILDAVSVRLSEQRTAIIGANGSGKSTFARLINGLVMPVEGQVTVNGVVTHSNGKALRRKVGFVFQNPDIQFVFPTVEEDLAFGLKNLGLAEAEIKRRIDDILFSYGLKHTRFQSVHSLSGGEKQLLCVAAVLIMQPDIIVLDEPTTLLDLANRERLNQTLLQLPQQLVIVTHDLDFAAQCDRVLLMDRGKLVCSGSAASVIDRYLALVAQSN